jgi:hypothetical protein
MPNPEIIRQEIEKLLPHRDMDKEPSIDSVWLGADHGATFQATRFGQPLFEGQLPRSHTVLMETFGDPVGRERTVDEFTKGLGKPVFKYKAIDHQMVGFEYQDIQSMRAK